MDIITTDRRDFLKDALLSAAAIPFFMSCKGETFAQERNGNVIEAIRKNARPVGTEGMGAIDMPEKVGPKANIADESHSGQLIKISGTVYGPDGKTPAPNTLIYFYHTDINGLYGRGDEHKHGRYRGWMLTNANGSYAFVTIKPAQYPERRFAAHIHMTVTTPTAREDWIDSILFEGDSLISTREREEAGDRGGFNPILALKKGDGGLLYATRDIQLLQA